MSIILYKLLLPTEMNLLTLVNVVHFFFLHKSIYKCIHYNMLFNLILKLLLLV